MNVFKSGKSFGSDEVQAAPSEDFSSFQKTKEHNDLHKNCIENEKLEGLLNAEQKQKYCDCLLVATYSMKDKFSAVAKDEQGKIKSVATFYKLMAVDMKPEIEKCVAEVKALEIKK